MLDMEQRIVSLEKRMHKFETETSEFMHTTTQVLNYMGNNVSSALETIAEEYKKGFMEAALKILQDEIRNNK